MQRRLQLTVLPALILLLTAGLAQAQVPRSVVAEVFAATW